MDNYKSLLMETIAKNDLVSKPAKIKRAGKLKEDLLPDEVYNTLVRKSKKTYTVGVYSTLPGPGWHYEINTEYGVYAKVPDDEGFIAHWFIQGKPQSSVEEMEDMAHYLIDEYDCKEVSLDEYKRIVNGKNESLKEDVAKKNIEFTRSNIVKVLRNLGYEADVVSKRFKSGDYILEFDKRNNVASVYPLGKSDEEYDNIVDALKVFGRKIWTSPIKTCISIYGNESLTEDTVKTSDGKWTNKGKEGTHGKFRTKKEADAQRRAMFSNGFKENMAMSGKSTLNEVKYPEGDNILYRLKYYTDTDGYDLDYDDGDWVSFDTALERALQEIKWFKEDGTDIKLIEIVKIITDEDGDEESEELLKSIPYNHKKYGWKMMSHLPSENHTSYVIHNIMDWGRDYTNYDTFRSIKKIAKACEEYDDEYTAEEYEFVIRNSGLLSKVTKNSRYRWNESLKKSNKSLKEDFDTLYGITCRTTARGMQSLLTLDDKTVAFTSKEEASRCSRALDDSAGHVNRFVYYGVTQISGRNSKNLLVFDSYEEYKEYSDNFIENTRNQEEIARNKLLTVANDIIDELKEELIDAGLNIVNDKHKTYKDVDIDVFAYPSRAEIRIGAGISINGWSYGTITLSVNEDGIVRCDDSSCYVFDEPFEECSQYIVKKVKKLCERSMPKNESLKERYADDAVILTVPLRKKLNKICQKYSGFHLPQEIAPMWDEFYNLGVEVLIQGYPTDKAPGAKSWTVPFTLNGETVDNSRFVYSVYEGSTGLKNDYNMYFS